MGRGGVAQAGDWRELTKEQEENQGRAFPWKMERKDSHEWGHRLERREMCCEGRAEGASQPGRCSVMAGGRPETWGFCMSSNSYWALTIQASYQALSIRLSHWILTILQRIYGWGVVLAKLWVSSMSHVSEWCSWEVSRSLFPPLTLIWCISTPVCHSFRQWKRHHQGHESITEQT